MAALSHYVDAVSPGATRMSLPSAGHLARIPLSWQHGSPRLGGPGAQASVFMRGRLLGHGCFSGRRHALIFFPHLAPKGPGNGIEEI